MASDWVRAAELAQARAEGSYAKGKVKVLLHQDFALCKADHRKWRLKGSTHAVCGECHPPVAFAADEIEWLDELKEEPC